MNNFCLQTIFTCTFKTIENIRGAKYMANILSLEERGERDEQFIREFVNNGGNSSAAARSIGVSEASASTTGHRMKDRLSKDIQNEIESNMRGFAPKAVEMLKHLVESAESENVKLHAAKDLLDRTGYKPTEKQSVEYKSEVEDLSLEEIKAQLDVLNRGWLQDFLKDNNLKLVDAEKLEEVSEELRNRLEILHTEERGLNYDH